MNESEATATTIGWLHLPAEFRHHIKTLNLYLPRVERLIRARSAKKDVGVVLYQLARGIFCMSQKWATSPLPQAPV